MKTRVIITNVLTTDGVPYGPNIVWYKIGQQYTVRDYRHNGAYWELYDWDGNSSPPTGTNNYWILKRHTAIIKPEVEKFDNIDEKLFRIN